ncbi:MAG: ankyrin repeat domain-containing protein [Gammaproteobacteria bacterium]|jgi:hypothetical protein|nr:ankyrin repeat domain-containing protein [Gammaproteobacteria bacterium]
MIAGANTDTNDLVNLMRNLKLNDRKTDEKQAIELLTRKPQLSDNAFSRYHMTPLMAGIYRKHTIVSTKLFEVLLHSTAKINAQNAEGKSVLHFLSYYAKSESKRLQYLEKLLKEKKDSIDVNILTLDNETPVYMAAIAGNPQALHLLVLAGANVNIANKQGQSPLQVACFKGDEISISILLAAGSKVNAADASGRTAIHYLAQCQAVDEETKQRILFKLLEHGAKAALICHQHQLAEQGAMQFGNKNLAVALQANRVPSLFNICSRHICNNLSVYTSKIPAFLEQTIKQQQKCT